MAIVTNSQVGLGALGQNMFLDCFMVFSYKALCDYCWLPILVSECHCINPVGLPHDVLTHDFFVPGSTTRKDCDIYKGKELFSTILTTSPETCATYFKRAIEDGFVLSILCSWFFIPEMVWFLLITYWTYYQWQVMPVLPMRISVEEQGNRPLWRRRRSWGRVHQGRGGFKMRPNYLSRVWLIIWWPNNIPIIFTILWLYVALKLQAPTCSESKKTIPGFQFHPNMPPPDLRNKAKSPKMSTFCSTTFAACGSGSSRRWQSLLLWPRLRNTRNCLTRGASAATINLLYFKVNILSKFIRLPFHLAKANTCWLVAKFVWLTLVGCDWSLNAVG